MKKILIFIIFLFPLSFISCKGENADRKGVKAATLLNVSDGEIIYLTNDSFKKLIFDYEKHKEWKYEGKRPAIIDFYADWCGPCRQIAPIIEELAKEYSGQIDIYKVDTEKETILAQSLGITGLPTLLFIPSSGAPQAAMGALSKEIFVQAINDILLKK